VPAILLLVGAVCSACQSDSGREAAVARTDVPDFSAFTTRPDLYAHARAIPERFYETPGCTVGTAEEPRTETGVWWTNYITDEQLSNPGPPAWVVEPPGSPDAHGTYEVTQFPCRRPTAGQVRAAQSLWDRSLDAAIAHDWFDLEKAEADGFHIGHPGERIHYVNDEFMVDDDVLVPERPEFLVVFEAKSGERLLAGFMYMLPTIGPRGPQIGGPLTVWHYHILDLHCWDKGLILARPDANGACAVGVPSRRTPEMLHVWFFDRTHGPFASDMKPPKSLRTGPSSSCHGLPEESDAVACEDAPKS